MWVSPKRWKDLEEKVAGLEERVSEIQVQQRYDTEEAKRCLRAAVYRFQTDRHESLAEVVAQSALKDSDSLTFRVNLGNRRLFERSSELK